MPFGTRPARLSAIALSLATTLTGAPAFAAGADDAAMKHALELLSKHPLIDGHNDLPYVIREDGTPPRDIDAYDIARTTPGDTDLARLRQGRVGAQFWSVYVPSSAEVKALGYARVQLEQIDIARRIIEKYPRDLQLTLTADDIEQANRDGRIASLLGVEGGHGIENSLGALRVYYRLGARYMTLTHFHTTDWADSATDKPRHGGLTRFGLEVVKEMNRLGMLVDLSHVAAETMHDALDTVEAPVIFSHSNARALTPHPRNVPDDVLRRLPKNGGLVMASFITMFNVKGPKYDAWQAGFAKASGGAKLGDANFDAERAKYVKDHPEPRATLKDVADHVEHIRKVAGIDHVGLGADYYGAPASMVEGMEDTSAYPKLFAELIRRGWKDDELIKLSRANLLRALRGAEQVAARLQKATAPSIETIEELDQGKDKPNLY
jgi:membrane dipeptidase